MAEEWGRDPQTRALVVVIGVGLHVLAVLGCLLVAPRSLEVVVGAVLAVDLALLAVLGIARGQRGDTQERGADADGPEGRGSPAPIRIRRAAAWVAGGALGVLSVVGADAVVPQVHSATSGLLPWAATTAALSVLGVALARPPRRSAGDGPARGRRVATTAAAAVAVSLVAFVLAALHVTVALSAVPAAVVAVAASCSRRSASWPRSLVRAATVLWGLAAVAVVGALGFAEHSDTIMGIAWAALFVGAGLLVALLGAVLYAVGLVRRPDVSTG